MSIHKVLRGIQDGMNVIFYTGESNKERLTELSLVYWLGAEDADASKYEFLDGSAYKYVNQNDLTEINPFDFLEYERFWNSTAWRMRLSKFRTPEFAGAKLRLTGTAQDFDKWADDIEYCFNDGGRHLIISGNSSEIYALKKTLERRQSLSGLMIQY